MKVYVKQSVYDKSFERMEWVFREFKGRVICSSSGGKDSTSVFEIAMDVIAKLQKENFLPLDYKLKVLWLDQEAEWTKTREYMERKSLRDDVEMYWMQVKFDLGHNASLDDFNKLSCFDPEYEGVFCQPLSELAYDNLYVNEDGSPMSIEELNKYRKLVDGRWVFSKELKHADYTENSFYKIFDDLYTWMANGKSYAVLQGVKSSESPRRSLQMTYQQGYKGITWSSSCGKRAEHVKFSPIYDWSRTDNFIHFHQTGCDYNKMYDDFLMYGIAPSNMRVSSLIHETSVAHNLTILQEVDRELYNRMCERLPGISTYSQLQEDTQSVQLPPNFTDYESFARYLIEHALTEKNRHYFLEMFETKFYQERKEKPLVKLEMDKCIIQSVLTKDVDKTKWQNMIAVIIGKEKKEKNYGIK